MMSLPVWLPGPMFPRKGGLSLSGGSLSRGCLCQGGSVRETPLQTETPFYSEERAVRILLECFLATFGCWNQVLTFKK